MKRFGNFALIRSKNVNIAQNSTKVKPIHEAVIFYKHFSKFLSKNAAYLCTGYPRVTSSELVFLKKLLEWEENRCDNFDPMMKFFLTDYLKSDLGHLLRSYLISAKMDETALLSLQKQRFLTPEFSSSYLKHNHKIIMSLIQSNCYVIPNFKRFKIKEEIPPTMTPNISVKSKSCPEIMAMVEYIPKKWNMNNTRLVMLDKKSYKQFKALYLKNIGKFRMLNSKNNKNLLILNFDIIKKMSMDSFDYGDVNTLVLYANKIKFGKEIFKSKEVSSLKIKKYFENLYKAILKDPSKFNGNKDIIFINNNTNCQVNNKIHKESLVYLNDLIYKTLKKKNIQDLMGLEESKQEETVPLDLSKLIYTNAMAKSRDYKRVEEKNRDAFDDFQTTLRVAKIICSNRIDESGKIKRIREARKKSKIPVRKENKSLLMKSAKNYIHKLEVAKRNYAAKKEVMVIKPAKKSSMESNSENGLADCYLNDRSRLVGNAVRSSSTLWKNKKNVKKGLEKKEISVNKALKRINSKYSLTLAISRVEPIFPEKKRVVDTSLEADRKGDASNLFSKIQKRNKSTNQQIKIKESANKKEEEKEVFPLVMTTTKEKSLVVVLKRKPADNAIKTRTPTRPRKSKIKDKPNSKEISADSLSIYTSNQSLGSQFANTVASALSKCPVSDKSIKKQIPKKTQETPRPSTARPKETEKRKIDQRKATSDYTMHRTSKMATIDEKKPFQIKKSKSMKKPDLKRDKIDEMNRKGEALELLNKLKQDVNLLKLNEELTLKRFPNKDALSLVDVKNMLEDIVNSSAIEEVALDGLMKKLFEVNKIVEAKKRDQQEILRSLKQEMQELPLIKANDKGEIICEKIDPNKVPDVIIDIPGTEDWVSTLKGSKSLQDNTNESSKLYPSKVELDEVFMNLGEYQTLNKRVKSFVGMNVENFGLFNTPLLKKPYKEEKKITKTFSEETAKKQISLFKKKEDYIAPYHVTTRNDHSLFKAVKNTTLDSAPKINTVTYDNKRRYSNWYSHIPCAKKHIQKRQVRNVDDYQVYQMAVMKYPKKIKTRKFDYLDKMNTKIITMEDIVTGVEKLRKEKKLKRLTSENLVKKLTKIDEETTDHKILQKFKSITVNDSIYTIAQNLQFDRSKKALVKTLETSQSVPLHKTKVMKRVISSPPVSIASTLLNNCRKKSKKLGQYSYKKLSKYLNKPAFVAKYLQKGAFKETRRNMSHNAKPSKSAMESGGEEPREEVKRIEYIKDSSVRKGTFSCKIFPISKKLAGTVIIEHDASRMIQKMCRSQKIKTEEEEARPRLTKSIPVLKNSNVLKRTSSSD